MFNRLKIFVRLFIGLPVWIRNICYEKIYSTNHAFHVEGCELLGTHGYGVYPKQIEKKEIEELRQDFRELQKGKSFQMNGQSSGRLYAHGPISELSKKYIAKFRPLAEMYFGSKDIRCELTLYQKSWAKTNIDDVPGGEYHEDDNKRNMKFFIYLTDVNVDNGPFCYVPKTHGLRRTEKYIRWLFWEIFHDRKYLYSYMQDKEHCQFNEIKFTGPAGTVFCADTTGYHRASTPVFGEREVFVVSYTRL